MTEAQANTFQFDLVSPEKKLMSEPARMVVVPGEEGDFGVLVEHSALVSSIRPGILSVYGNDNDEPFRVFVAGGFADVTPSSCTVLAEEAIPVADLDKDGIEKDIHNLIEDLGLVEGEADKARVAHRLVVARAKLQAVTGHTVL